MGSTGDWEGYAGQQIPVTVEGGAGWGAWGEDYVGKYEGVGHDVGH